MKTYMLKINEIKNNWYIIDAKNKILGRLATKLSQCLRGKNKTQYTPNINMGDYIIVLNVNKIILTGKKKNKKIYYHHTGYPGGIKKIYFKNMLKYKPENILKKAVKGMLPKGPLGYKMLNKLKIYVNKTHKHESQKPKILKI